MKPIAAKLTVLALLGLAIGAFFALDLDDYVTLDHAKSKQKACAAFYADHRRGFSAAYMGVYIAFAALSLPGAAVMSLVGAALFGFWTTLAMVSFASSIGATLAFWVSRFLLRDWVQARFGDKLKAVNQGVARDGAFYLFTLRLVPVIPFFAINLVMGVTPIRSSVFYAISQIGMLPGTAVFVNAGTRLAEIDCVEGLLSPGLMLSLALLGVFPLIAKKILGMAGRRRVLGRFVRPRRFDYNVVVIGAGSAGLVSAYIAATVKAKVALIEKQRMGGDCLNTGCVPSKALIRAAGIVADARRAEAFGLGPCQGPVDFARVMEQVRQVIGQVAPHDSIARYTGLGVDCIMGQAKVVSPYAVAVNGRTLTTRAIVIATGATPAVPAIEGLDKLPSYTSDTIWDLRALPRRLVVLGGGPIGCELAQAFARFGAQVTLVHSGPHLLAREDPDMAAFLQARFQAEGLTVLTGHRAKRVMAEGSQPLLICQAGGRDVSVPADALLLALGRIPYTAELGLEQIGVGFTGGGIIESDAYLRTSVPTIFVAGDVAGGAQFTHMASHMAWYASVNALAGGLASLAVDHRVVPWATFTDPQVARVGLNETQAAAQGVACEVTRFDFADLDRAIAEGQAQGQVKVLTAPGRDKILGATIVGPQAGEIIAEFVLAMKHGIGLNKILQTIHIYPTFAEAAKHTAGNWKKAHIPQGLLGWIGRYLAWRRG